MHNSVYTIPSQPAEGVYFFKISSDASVGVPTRCRRDKFLKSAPRSMHGDRSGHSDPNESLGSMNPEEPLEHSSQRDPSLDELDELCEL